MEPSSREAGQHLAGEAARVGRHCRKKARMFSPLLLCSECELIPFAETYTGRKSRAGKQEGLGVLQPG